MVERETIGDRIGGITVIEWEDNPDGPDSRVIESDHPFYHSIVDEAREDPDANVKRL
jgi:hypothetical protein